MKPTMYIVNG